VNYDPIAGTVTYYPVSSTGSGNPVPSAVGIPANCQLSAPSGYVGAVASNSSSGQQQEQVCETKGGWGAEILCGLVDAINSTIQTLYGFVLGHIQFTIFEPVSASVASSGGGLDSDTYSKVHGAWLAVVRLADTIMVIVFMVMIFGTTIGGYIDAYTWKKMFPQIALAFILVNISWDLYGWFLEACNIIALGLQGLITSPFGNSATLAISTNPAESTAVIGGLLTAGVAAGIALVTGGIFILLPMVVGAAVAVFMGFVFVIVRELLVVGGAIFIPFYFALRPLPGMKKVTDKGRDLLVAPGVATIAVYSVFGLGALGYHLAVITNSDANGNINFTGFIIALGCLVGPALFAPKILERIVADAGFILAGIRNFGSNMTNKAKKTRDERVKENKKQGQVGNRFSNNNPFGRFGNKVAKVGSRNPVSWVPGVGGKKAAGYRGQAMAQSQEALKEMQQKTGVTSQFAYREFAAHGGSRRSLRARANELMATGDPDNISTANGLLALEGFAGRSDAQIGAGFGAGGKLRAEDAWSMGKSAQAMTGDKNFRDYVVDSAFMNASSQEMMQQFNRATDFNFDAKDSAHMYNASSGDVNQVLAGQGINAASATDAQRASAAKEAVHQRKAQRFQKDYGDGFKFSPEDIPKIKSADDAKDYANGIMQVMAQHGAIAQQASAEIQGVADDQAKYDRAVQLVNRATTPAARSRAQALVAQIQPRLAQRQANLASNQQKLASSTARLTSSIGVLRTLSSDHAYGRAATKEAIKSSLRNIDPNSSIGQALQNLDNADYSNPLMRGGPAFDPTLYGHRPPGSGSGSGSGSGGGAHT
jgi:hypothetical protein